ncbi:hypothetical protein ACFOOM_10010 [Streptomyces echinoruber]|uniref:Uncharacterized protein n=1 Tax=Streptomyces echinoruber TaxID=68898 RepID=A0A918VSV8_9ACTN|nr:hypothetical protein [Streptomyces echinoruber]GHA19783.1 hypothetical protein GCM10010389_66540 [Streptomyces echinoruber]
MDLYCDRRAVRRTTGHYRKPGTDRSYCGRDLDHTPTPADQLRAVCKTCTKAEKSERVAAEQEAANYSATAPSLRERADVRYALVGKGHRVHYSPNNDETLCGRVVSEYAEPRDIDLSGRLDGLCSRCIKAAEERAYARALAAASPLAAAAADLAETVEQADAERAATPTVESATVPGTLVDPWTWIRRPSSSDAAKAAEERAERRQQLADSRGANAYPLAVAAVRQFVREMPKGGALRVPVVEGAPEATLTRDDLYALAYSGHTTADAIARVRAAVDAHIRHGEREVHEIFPAQAMRPALYLPDVMALLNRWDDDQVEAEKFERAAHAVDAVEHAEQTGARVETVEDAEALYAAALVTEAEATDGTWRGEWIGEQQAADTLFDVDRPSEQGALFDDRATRPATVREQQRAALDRVKAKAAAERAAYRAETDDAIAVECAAHGVPAPRTVADRIAARTEQAPERRVVEGVIVSHNGRTKGTAPKHSTDPDALAALAALGDLRKAEVSDHTDIAAQPGDLDHAPDAWGFLVEPRGHGRVALYWLECGRYVRRDGEPWTVELEIGADRLRKAGWKIEPHARRCVFAWRPTE